jgi:UDP-N-acetylglucosamine transferase subunit ALG13
VIFATCGSTDFPFDRMMQALAALPVDDLCVQHGPAQPPPCAEAYPFLPFTEVLHKIEQADVVISHAGVGSIMCAIRAGHTPIIFPRQRRYSETVDDHQVELARALAQRGTALLAGSGAELAAAVVSLPERRRTMDLPQPRLAAAVRAAVRGETPTLVVS